MEGQKESISSLQLSRRRLLKLALATGGAAAASSMLPTGWIKPEVRVGVLPAFAQMSACSPTSTTAALYVSNPLGEPYRVAVLHDGVEGSDQADVAAGGQHCFEGIEPGEGQWNYVPIDREGPGRHENMTFVAGQLYERTLTEPSP